MVVDLGLFIARRLAPRHKVLIGHLALAGRPDCNRQREGRRGRLHRSGMFGEDVIADQRTGA